MKQNRIAVRLAASMALGLFALTVGSRTSSAQFISQCDGDEVSVDKGALDIKLNVFSMPSGSEPLNWAISTVNEWARYSKLPVRVIGQNNGSTVTEGDWHDEVALTNRSSIDGNNGKCIYSGINWCFNPPGMGNYSEADMFTANDMNFGARAPSDIYLKNASPTVGGGRSTMLHEMGHALGMGEAGPAFTAMYQNAKQRPQPTVMPHDIFHVNHLYGAKGVVDLVANGQRMTSDFSAIVTNHEVPEVVCRGGNFTLFLTTLNLGSVSKTMQHRASISFSSTGGNPAAIWTVSDVVVPTGNPLTQTWNATMPTNVALGTYFLFHDVDTTAAVAEAVETNNKLRYTGTITVIDCPKTIIKVADFDGNGMADDLGANRDRMDVQYSNGTGTFKATNYFRSDLNSNNSRYTTGDFNGDGKKDVIITTPSGSYWYYSTGVGTWNTTAYSRSDLPIGAVEFTPGDFNGDGKTDVIITTSSGSEWYYSTGTGTWNVAYKRNINSSAGALPLGTVTYTVADFSGDGKQDVIITTAAGSFWYFSTGTGTWNTTAFQRTDLPRGTVEYTTGNFNGDSRQDMIVTTALGSFWFYSTGLGTWNSTAYQRTDLPLGTVSYTAADFSGDGFTDLIISTSLGAFWYFGTGTGTWVINAYNRPDLPRGTAQYFTGNLNGDNFGDVIILTSTGAYWYYSTGLGTWNNSAYSRGDWTL